MGDNDFDRGGGGGYDRRDHSEKRCPSKLIGAHNKKMSCSGILQDGRLVKFGAYLCPTCLAIRCDMIGKQDEDKDNRKRK